MPKGELRVTTHTVKTTKQAKRRYSSFTATLTIIIEVLREVTPCSQTSNSLHFVGMHLRFQVQLVPTKIIENAFIRTSHP